MGVGAILVMWPNYLVQILTNLSYKESSHEIWVQLGQWFMRKLCFNILMGLQYERLSWKVNLDLLELIYSHCLIRLNISSENYD